MIKAVGFDIDGTLYPESFMFLSSVPLVLKHPRLVYHFSRARITLRQAAAAGEIFSEGFRTRQAAAVLASMGKKIDDHAISDTKSVISREIYGKWEKAYAAVKPFRDVRRAWLELERMGLKLGLLSDFPLGIKPQALGVDDLTTAYCCAEETGYLKPRPEPFIQLAQLLGCKPEEMIYVGNSYEKDVIGAKSVGMITALVTRSKPNLKRTYPLADIIFSRYAELPQLLTSYL